MPFEFYTIGVFGSTDESFFKKLIDARIDTFCDIRNRRAVRGSKYSYVNSKKLQDKLSEKNIQYLYVKDLSPSKEIRNLQKEADKKQGVRKTERTSLGEVFKFEYNNKVLKPFDFNIFFNELKDKNCKKIVLFCVEKDPTACHRSLVSERLSQEFHYKINHL